MYDLKKFNLESLHELKNLVMDRPLIAFDTETTGINVSMDEIVELMAIKIHNDGKIEELYLTFNPVGEIKEESSKIHGFTKEKLATSPRFKEKANEIFDFFNECDLFAYNGYKFDIPLITEEFHRYGIKYNPMKYNIIDPYNIMYKKEPRRLSDVYYKIFKEELTDAHSATSDIIASLRIFDYQIKEYGLAKSVKEISNFVKHDINGYLILDFDSLFKYDNESGDIFYNKGKHIHKKIKNHLDYLDWIIEKSYYCMQTKEMGKLIKSRILKESKEVTS